VLALLEQAVVERIRTPPTPYLEPSDWMARRLEDLEYRFEDGEPIEVIDDAIAAHPLLDGTVRSRRSFPAAHSWAQPSRHGTMVAGLAAYGEFEARCARACRWSRADRFTRPACSSRTPAGLS
jgi:hypothetical protein